jgi:hypothetical protein
MIKFIKVVNNRVVNTIVATQEHINNLDDRDFYIKDDITQFKNSPGKNYTYSAIKNAFIPPKPYNSWTLNETTCKWEAPVARPDDGQNYNWNEETQQWDLVDNS